MNAMKAKCVLPLNINPFDDFVKPYLSKQKTLKCSKRDELTYVDYEKGILKLSEVVKNKYSCFYSWIHRGSNDQSILHTTPIRIPKSGIKFSTKNYVANVSCYKNVANGSKIHIYKNTHLWIPDFSITNANGPSVFILVIESLSYNSFIRFMNKTNEAMKKLKHFSILRGLTKVASNSFPNSMALIAGKAVEGRTSRAMNDYWDKKLDYIWDKFKAKGYVTGFVEDFVKIGLFDYQRKGFKSAPTDFFPRPFWLQMFLKGWNLYDSMLNVKQYCFDDHGPRVEIFLNHLLQFVKKMQLRKQSYFMYAFYSQMTHEDFNNFRLVDSFVADFFLKMASHLSDTVLIFMGDHGPRFGPMTDTPLGYLESRLPMFAIRVPENLHEKFPHLRKVLQLNEKRLLSYFDINKLLIDTAMGDFSYIKTPNLTSINPWRQIVPPQRTCKDARIPKVFCVCNGIVGRHTDIGWHHTHAEKALIKQVNSWLSGDCSPLQPHKITFLEQIMPRKNESLSLVERLNISVSVKNSNLKITAMMKRTAKNLKSPWNKWSIDSEFTNVFQLKSKVINEFCTPKNTKNGNDKRGTKNN
ncbi:hypothetical protein B4U79_15048 [Dinothrombium tinctorium]|uniref:Uncharacterized protein n=1 Tax=Dinothrombium tinctorium TaxID=1965070 RepID=A0A3S4R0K9_9ACAR|nr:hypothetical protein B4U79_15048 [Dinothrombium tinctorium]